MKNTYRTLLVFSLVLTFASPAQSAEEVTAEELGQFYPAQWQKEAIGNTAFSHLEIPGHQKASTSQYYAFGEMEFIYYAPQDSVYAKRVEKLKNKDKHFEDVEINGMPAVVFTKHRVIADVGGEILVYLECYTCESREDLMKRFEMIDLAGCAGLLDR